MLKTRAFGLGKSNSSLEKEARPFSSSCSSHRNSFKRIFPLFDACPRQSCEAGFELNEDFVKSQPLGKFPD
ncbi:hypothetical protein MA16_Dca023468 [Dendrobium catenatum]|uniref:Uncharacterized protein n=1 Tax=Dendrobium catenatum TaxID=906689 RepID=A0A2I0XIE3_9ASPA|nr:hypothetical protein MA16_Dca023468 [Dendrobium catenatum]